MVTDKLQGLRSCAGPPRHQGPPRQACRRDISKQIVQATPQVLKNALLRQALHTPFTRTVPPTYRLDVLRGVKACQPDAPRLVDLPDNKWLMGPITNRRRDRYTRRIV